MGEQSEESNVVIITKDSEAIVITAEAYIDEESDGVKIEWTTSNPNGSFEIFMSEDNENFTSVGIAENANEFVYSPEKSFLTLYFKVKQTVGKKSAESNVDRVIDWNNDIDSDEDGISDLDEIYTFFTDPANPDTDGYGLPDGYEMFTLDTNPLSADTDGNGIADGNEDIDGDGLTNLTEYELGTSPRDKDSDEDGLTDGDEVHIYGTNPLKFDTDGDNVSDGDEIALGLDPNNAATNGIPDNERTFAQTIPADDWLFYNINTENNPFEFSIEITAAGVAINNIEACFSGYSYSMRNDAILGNIPEFSYNENLKIDDIKINFDLDKNVINSYNDKYKDISEELSGIKRFNVFRYFEDTNMLLPIETFHDEAAGRVYAHTTETGTYCLIDMAAWLDSLGFAEYTARAERSVMTYSAEKSAGNDIDIIFILHSTTVYADFIKDELTNFIDSAYSHANSVHMYFVSNGGDVFMINGREYAETAEECKTILGRFKGSAASANVNKGFAAARNLELRDGSQQHMFMLDGCSEPTCGSANGNLNAILENGVNFGIVCNIANSNTMNYKLLANYNVRENIILFKDFMLDQIDFTDITEDEDYVITANGLVPIPEDFGDISMDSEKDYDNDGLLDVQEIYFDVTDKNGNTLITVNDDGSVVLPNFNECVEAGGTYVESGLKRFYDEADNDIMEFLDIIKVLPLISDPTSEDGDRDGILDNDEHGVIDDMRFAMRSNESLYTNHIVNLQIPEKKATIDSASRISDVEDDTEEFNNPSLLEEDKFFNTNFKDIIFVKKETEVTVDSEEPSENEMILDNAYPLARQFNLEYAFENSDDAAYGIIGDKNESYYIEAYTCMEDGKRVNYLSINSNIRFSSRKITAGDGDVLVDEILTEIYNQWGFKGETMETMVSTNTYDFSKGMEINVSLTFNRIKKNTGDKTKSIYYDCQKNGETLSEDYECGKYACFWFNDGTDQSDNNTDTMPPENKINNDTGRACTDIQMDGISYVYLYKYDQEKEANSKSVILNIAVHEFGHTLGLMDVYGSDNMLNYYMEPISHLNDIDEIYFKYGEPTWENSESGPKLTGFETKIFRTSKAGEMMHRHGKVSVNDIEMALYACKNRKEQYYVPKGRTCNLSGETNEEFELSNAIRQKYFYISTKYNSNDFETKEKKIYWFSKGEYKPFDDTKETKLKIMAEWGDDFDDDYYAHVLKLYKNENNYIYQYYGFKRWYDK